MGKLYVDEASFDVDNGRFSSTKRYLYQPSDSSNYEIGLPVVNKYTIEVQGEDGEGAEPGSIEELFNFVYSNNKDYVKFNSIDSGFRSEYETFIKER